MSHPSPPCKGFPPLQVYPHLAQRWGLKEALVLQQLQRWLTASSGSPRGTPCGIPPGIPFPNACWAELFSFWSERTLRRAFHTLESRDLISAAPLKAGGKNVKTYTLTPQAIMCLAPPEREEISSLSAETSPYETSRPPQEKGRSPGHAFILSGRGDHEHWVTAQPATSEGQLVPTTGQTVTLLGQAVTLEGHPVKVLRQVVTPSYPLGQFVSTVGHIDPDLGQSVTTAGHSVQNSRDRLSETPGCIGKNIYNYNFYKKNPPPQTPPPGVDLREVDPQDEEEEERCASHNSLVLEGGAQDSSPCETVAASSQPLLPHPLPQLIALWNQHVQSALTPGKPVRATPKRWQKLQQLFTTLLGADVPAWEAYCQAIAQHGFLMGFPPNASGFRVTFDWALDPENAVKVLEGALYAKNPGGQEKPLASSESTGKRSEEASWQAFEASLRAAHATQGYEPFWTAVCLRLSRWTSVTLYEAWFKDIVPGTRKEGVLSLALPTPFLRDYVQTRYKDVLLKAVQAEDPTLQAVTLTLGGPV